MYVVNCKPAKMKSTSIQTDITKDTENVTLDERKIYLELAVLANILQHGSYCFFLMDLYLTETHAHVQGSSVLAKMVKSRENACSESATFIMGKILLEEFGAVDLADVKKPELREKHLGSLDLCTHQIEIIDNWIFKSIKERSELLKSNNYNEKTIDKLDLILQKHRILHYDSQHVIDN